MYDFIRLHDSFVYTHSLGHICMIHSYVYMTDSYVIYVIHILPLSYMSHTYSQLDVWFIRLHDIYVIHIYYIRVIDWYVHMTYSYVIYVTRIHMMDVPPQWTWCVRWCVAGMNESCHMNDIWMNRKDRILCVTRRHVCDMTQSVCDTSHSICDMTHSTCDMPHSMCDICQMRHDSFCVCHDSFMCVICGRSLRLRHFVCDMTPSMCRMPYFICGMTHPMRDMCVGHVCGMTHSMPDMTSSMRDLLQALVPATNYIWHIYDIWMIHEHTFPTHMSHTHIYDIWMIHEHTFYTVLYDVCLCSTLHYMNTYTNIYIYTLTFTPSASVLHYIYTHICTDIHMYTYIDTFCLGSALCIYTYIYRYIHT